MSDVGFPSSADLGVSLTPPAYVAACFWFGAHADPKKKLKIGLSSSVAVMLYT